MTRTRLAVLALCLCAFLAAASQALGANSISLVRDPGPPQAVLNDGAHALSYRATVNFDSLPDRVEFSVEDPSGAVTALTPVPLGGQSSPFVSPLFSFPVAAGAQPGRWRLYADYYSNVGIESSVDVTFLVANAVGSMRLVKFEDLNGNGRQEPGEPGVANWPMTLTGPAGLLSETVTVKTGADGALVVPSLFTGSYQVAEGAAPQPATAGDVWANTDGATTKTIQVNAGQSADAVFANARLGSICGVVYRDDNANGRRDPQEDTRVGGSVVRLSGPATGSVTTGADGAYCFERLLPGAYRVDNTAPAPLSPSGDADGPANGDSLIAVALSSGGRIVRRDFGVTPPAAKLAITKRASSKVRRGGDLLTWTITVRNTSKVTAKAVAVSDPLPLRASIVSLGAGHLRAGLIIWSVGDLRPGKAKTVRFVVRLDRGLRGGRIVNRASAEATNARQVTAAASVRLIPRPPAKRKIAVTG